MRNLAVIPARSGSKGLKDKNIKKLSGKPLLAYSIEAALKSKLFSEVMVSTDSEYYKEIAIKYGAEVPFLRSEKNSNDNANSWDTVFEVLNFYKKKDIYFNTVCLLQPTSPLRKGSDIIEGYNALDENECDSIYGVCECDHSPLWANILPNDKNMREFFHKDSFNKNRQELATYYRINGAIYIKKIKYENSISLLDDYPFAILMDKRSSIDIDEQFDFDFAEFLIESGK